MDEWQVYVKPNDNPKSGFSQTARLALNDGVLTVRDESNEIFTALDNAIRKISINNDRFTVKTEGQKFTFSLQVLPQIGLFQPLLLISYWRNSRIRELETELRSKDIKVVNNNSWGGPVMAVLLVAFGVLVAAALVLQITR